MISVETRGGRSAQQCPTGALQDAGRNGGDGAAHGEAEAADPGGGARHLPAAADREGRGPLWQPVCLFW